MKTEADETVAHHAASARVSSRFGPRWLRGYVASKLRSDPVFPAAYELLCASDLPVLDLGCGVGLLALYLRERQFRADVTGVDCDARKLKHAVTAGRDDQGLSFLEKDVRHPFAFHGNVAVFDLLHYLTANDQQALLKHLAACIAPGGLLIIRDAPREKSLRFYLTFLAETFAQAISWNLSTPLHFPTRRSICDSFHSAAFTREIRPLWGRTPFNNQLFIFRKAAVGTD